MSQSNLWCRAQLQSVESHTALPQSWRVVCATCLNSCQTVLTMMDHGSRARGRQQQQSSANSSAATAPVLHVTTTNGVEQMCQQPKMLHKAVLPLTALPAIICSRVQLPSE